MNDTPLANTHEAEDGGGVSRYVADGERVTIFLKCDECEGGLASMCIRPDCIAYSVTPRLITHFVGFRGDEYLSAVRCFGKPDFIHMGWDMRSVRDIGMNDRVIFATGDEFQPFAKYNLPEIHEPRL